MGVLIASTVVLAWASHLAYVLFGFDFSWANPWTYVHIFVQGYLYTGLFITAHDAMHGTVSSKRVVNQFFGWVSAFFFAAFFYSKLIKKHMMHHRHPGTAEDPDFHVKSQRFWPWFFSFFAHYVQWLQILIMAVLFNLLRLVAPVENIVVFWIVPAFLGTLQLFYFGTYLPHKKPETDPMKPHHARTQKKNHLWAMVSCYFFGYHWEHHQWPRTPWWKLYERKNEYMKMLANKDDQ